MENLSNKNEVKPDRRDSIIVSGLKVFCEKGYDGTTVDDIVKKAGCSHGLFYHYFKSKKEVFDQVMKSQNHVTFEEIQEKIYQQVRENCEANYGIVITDVNILRVSLPDTNLESVFYQMTAERQKEIDTILAEAQRDANKITADADAEAAKIVAQGQIEAAEIKAKTEKEVAEIYAKAQNANVELYKFLQELDALVASVNEDSVLVVTADSYPFNLLLEYSNMENTGTSDEVIISDLNYIMSQLSNTDREALTTAIFTLLTEVEGAGL